MKKALKLFWYALFLLTLIACTSPDDERNSNMTKGEEIITAIKSYQGKYDNAPISLTLLVPEFLSEIPLTFSGQEFVYDAKGSFAYGKWTLTFDVASNNTGCTYISHFELWDCWPPNAGD